VFNLVSAVRPAIENPFPLPIINSTAEPRMETPRVFTPQEVSPILPIEATTPIHNFNIDYATILLFAMMVASAALLIQAFRQYRLLRKCFGNDELVYSDVPAPFVFGLITPTIVLPLGMESGTLKIALYHEKMHVKLNHHKIKLLLTVFRKLFWFNPFIYLFCAAVDSDLELACDEYVLKLTDEQGEKLIKPDDYVAAMLSAAMFQKTRFASVNSAVSCFVENNLKKRAERILTMKKMSKIAIVIMSAVTVLLAISLITGAQASSQFAGTTLVTEAEVGGIDVFTSYQEQILDDGELFSMGLIFRTDGNGSTSCYVGERGDTIHADPEGGIAGVVTNIVGFSASLIGWIDYDPADFTSLVLTRDGVAIEKRYVYTGSKDMNQFTEWSGEKRTDINFEFRRTITEPGVYRLTGKYQGRDFGSSSVIVEEITTSYSICFVEPFIESGTYEITGKYMGAEFGTDIVIWDEAPSWDFTDARFVYMDDMLEEYESRPQYGFSEEMASDFVDRPFLGITGLGVTERLAERNNIPFIGVCVDSVLEDSGAENAGIKPLDIIVGFNNTKITTMEQLWDAIGDFNIGDKVIVDLYRGELPMQLEVVLGSFEQ
jgi:beta-lactamase regulating signal transducer with metallopeptidase domain